MSKNLEKKPFSIIVTVKSQQFLLRFSTLCRVRSQQATMSVAAARSPRSHWPTMNVTFACVTNSTRCPRCKVQHTCNRFSHCAHHSFAKATHQALSNKHHCIHWNTMNCQNTTETCHSPRNSSLSKYGYTTASFHTTKSNFIIPDFQNKRQPATKFDLQIFQCHSTESHNTLRQSSHCITRRTTIPSSRTPTAVCFGMEAMPPTMPCMRLCSPARKWWARPLSKCVVMIWWRCSWCFSSSVAMPTLSDSVPVSCSSSPTHTY